jgi:hypothetical protein
MSPQSTFHSHFFPQSISCSQSIPSQFPHSPREISSNPCHPLAPQLQDVTVISHHSFIPCAIIPQCIIPPVMGRGATPLTLQLKPYSTARYWPPSNTMYASVQQGMDHRPIRISTHKLDLVGPPDDICKKKSFIRKESRLCRFRTLSACTEAHTLSGTHSGRGLGLPTTLEARSK